MAMAARWAVMAWLALGLTACGGGEGEVPQFAVADPIPSVGEPEDPIPDEVVPDNLPPSAAISATPSQGSPPLSVAFSASASADTDGSIRSYRWDFGDGSEAFGVTASYTYTEFGAFTVRLTVTDDDGAVDSATTVITVQADNPNLPPSASFSAIPREGPAPLTVGFDASSAADSGGGIGEYRWAFGDGATGFGVNASHTYTRPGVFTAQLTVIDTDGAQSSASVPITVRAPSDVDAGETPTRSAAAAAAPLSSGAVGPGGRQVVPLSLEAGETLRVVVEDYAEEASARNDLDVYLFDVSDPQRPRYLASSVGGGEWEAVRAPAAGRYELLIESSAGSSAYSVLAAEALSPASLEDPFVEAQIVVLPAQGVLPSLPGLRMRAGTPDRPMLLDVLPESLADDRYWGGAGAPTARYQTVRALKRVRTVPGIAAADLNYLRQPGPLASGGEVGGRSVLAWPAGVAAPDEQGQLASYDLIQWLRVMGGLSNDLGIGGAGAEQLTLRWARPSGIEAATLEAVTARGVVVTTTP